MSPIRHLIVRIQIQEIRTQDLHGKVVRAAAIRHRKVPEVPILEGVVEVGAVVVQGAVDLHRALVQDLVAEDIN